MATPPVVKSFLIADTVIQDRASGKWSVIGIFDRVLAASFPVVHPSLSIYLKLADAMGRYRVGLELRDAADRRVSAFPEFQIEVKDRAQPVELAFPTHMLPLEKPGSYQFQLLLNGDCVASCRLDVLKVDPTAAPPGPA